MDCQNIPCATLKRRGSVGNICISLVDMFHLPDLLTMCCNSWLSDGQVGQVGTAAGSGSHTDSGGGGGGGVNTAAATSGYFIMALKGKARRARGCINPLGSSDFDKHS